jgi:replicative DNA helicase
VANSLVREEGECVVEESHSTPHDAEVKVLGGLLLRPESLGQMVDLLHPEDFARERHRVIYAALLSLSQQHGPISAQTVCEILEQRGHLSSVGGSEYITSLSRPVEEQEMIELAASIQRRASARRRLLSAGERIQQLAQVEPDETIALDKAMQLLAQVKRNPSTFASPLGELLVECTQELSQLRSRSGELTGVPTGLVDLDTLTDGLQPSDMIMVAAPPASGKTSFVLSIAVHAALSTGRPIGMFSLSRCVSVT